MFFADDVLHIATAVKDTNDCHSLIGCIDLVIDNVMTDRQFAYPHRGPRFPIDGAIAFVCAEKKFPAGCGESGRKQSASPVM